MYPNYLPISQTPMLWSYLSQLMTTLNPFSRWTFSYSSISNLSRSLLAPLTSTSTQLSPLPLLTRWSHRWSSLTWIMAIAFQPICQPPFWLPYIWHYPEQPEGSCQNISHFVLLCLSKLCCSSTFHSEKNPSAFKWAVRSDKIWPSTLEFFSSCPSSLSLHASHPGLLASPQTQ